MVATVQKGGQLRSYRGRPKKGVLSTFADPVRSELLRLRHLHSQWGPKTLYQELCTSARLKSLRIPKPSTIAAFLKAQCLVKDYQKHIPLSNTAVHTVKQVHEQWQLDAQGAYQIDQLGKVVFINIKDVISKTYCGSLPFLSLAHNGSPRADDYRHALRLAFMEFGMPSKIQVDHAGVFYENTLKSPFPTRFHLWVVSLGMELIFSRKARPKDQAIVERAHQTLQKQLSTQGIFTSLQHLTQKTNERRQWLNYQLPCRSCKEQAPLIAYPQAKHSGRHYWPEMEKELMNLDRVYQYLAKGHWIRKVSRQKRIALAGQTYSIASASVNSKVRIRCCPETRQFLFEDYKSGRFLRTRAVKKLTLEHLQGTPFYHRNQYAVQLKIPYQLTPQSRPNT